MGFTRVATSSAWRSYASPTTEGSGARLGDWRALKPRFVIHRTWPTLAQAMLEEKTRTKSIDVDLDTAPQAESPEENENAF